jgi:integrase
MPTAEKKRRKRQPFTPYAVVIKGRKFYQVGLGSRTIKRVDGTKARKSSRRTFASREEAESFAELKRVEKRNHGAFGVSMPDKLRVEALESARLLEPFGVSLSEAVREYVSRRELVSKSVTVPEAVQAFLESKRKEGLRTSCIRDLEFRLGRFRESFAARKVADIEPGELHSWLETLGQSSLSRNMYHARVFALYAYCRTRGWTGANPLELVSRLKVSRGGKVGILEPEQAARLLESASEETLPFWAVGLFGGLRTAELKRLEWKDIRWDSGLIEVPALKSKTATRRFVEIRPNLAAWLLPYRQHSGLICPPGLVGTLQADRKRAGVVPWPANACRHSFASYHLAYFRDLKGLMLEIGHTNPDVTFRHYRELTTPAEAEKFWRIVPAIQGGAELTAVA